MSQARALCAVVEHLASGANPAYFSHDTVAQWGDDGLATLLQAGLLKPAAAASSIECHGCEERCFMDVVYSDANDPNKRAFVVCDVPENQAEMGRIRVPAARLQRWQCSAEMLACSIAQMLGMKDAPENAGAAGKIRLGMLQGSNGRRWVTLNLVPLSIHINQATVLVSDLLFVADDEIAIDTQRIRFMVDQVASSTKPYEASTDRREARKQQTAAMYKDWQDAYSDLLRRYPGKSKTWYSLRIARLDVARGRDPETIRKHLR